MSILGHRVPPSFTSRCLFYFPKLSSTSKSLHRPFSSSQALDTDSTNDNDNSNAKEGALAKADGGNTTLTDRLRQLTCGSTEKDWSALPSRQSGTLLATLDGFGEGIQQEKLVEVLKALTYSQKEKKRERAREKRQKRKQRKREELELEKQEKEKQQPSKEKKEKQQPSKEKKGKQQAWKEKENRKSRKERREKEGESTKPSKKVSSRQEPPLIEQNSYAQLSHLMEALKGAETGWGPDSKFLSFSVFSHSIAHNYFASGLQPPPSEEVTDKTSSEEPSSRLDRPAVAPHLQSPSVALNYSRRIEGLLEPTALPTLETVVPTSEHNPIATLAHGLDRVLFNPGVHWFQDPRSRVYNFPPHLEVIPKVTDFAFERLGAFIKSSRDNDLWDLARREKRTFAGSTSSLSGMLSHIYFLISGDKDVNTNNLSRHFQHEPRGFTAGQRMPASVILNHNDGIYAIDSDAEKDKMADKNILTWMGTLLEKYLTSTSEEFAPYMRFNPGPPRVDNPLRDAYRYAKSEKFVMRSQLDCVDTRLPGTGVFDIKTRACLPIRMDLLNFEENSGYLIRSATGKVESFEREYYDLIRSAFLKYSFQVRIGDMDGVIVAYHNTARMFGFQYISLQEMDDALFGPGTGVGDRVFNKCVGLLERVLEEAAACFPGESVKCTFEKLEGQSVMNVWVQPAERPTPKAEGEEGEGGVETEAESVLPPIRQLEVRASNFLGQEPVRGSMAVSSVDEPCKWFFLWDMMGGVHFLVAGTTHWSISKLASSGTDIHSVLGEAKQRQFRYIDIPTGWDEETVGKMWNALNFGGVERPECAAEGPLPDNFRAPTRRTQALRDIARAGGEETAKRVSEEEGQAKVWLGGTIEWEELQEVQDLLRRKEEAVSVIEEVTDEVVAAEQQLATEGEPIKDTKLKSPRPGENQSIMNEKRRPWATFIPRPGSSSGRPGSSSNGRPGSSSSNGRPGSSGGWSTSTLTANTPLTTPLPVSPMGSTTDLPRTDSFSSLRRIPELTSLQDDAPGPILNLNPNPNSTVNRASFTRSLSNMMGALSRTSTRDSDDRETRGRTMAQLTRVKSASSVPPTDGESDRSRSRGRSTSPFTFRRRRTEPSPPPSAVHYSDAESDADSSSIRPRSTAFSYDSADETEDDDWSEDDLFDDLTERNTEQNAQIVPPVQPSHLTAEDADPDPLGEGVNVVVPPEPYFPSTLNSSAPTKRNPRRKKSIKHHEPLRYETSRPVFQRDRCTITITQGDPTSKCGHRRKRRYIVASDLSEESRYAVEWAIGTVLRDGDDLLIVTVTENDAKVDPPIPNATDRSTKLRSQQERQGLAYILVRQATSLLQRTKLNVKVACQAWHAKNARHMLLDIVDYNEPQMVIVGSRGLGQLKGILLGSTSHYLIQKCSVPVMVARRRLKRPPKRAAHLSTQRTHVSLAEAGIDRVAPKVDEDVQVMREEIQRDDERRGGPGGRGIGGGRDLGGVRELGSAPGRGDSLSESLQEEDEEGDEDDEEPEDREANGKVA
ncbi:hypothetical protein H0H87_004637 [Tephrocybe sp. NHM501043]|nr:hypothetical protein H0H87_004637 [Tephrocybe sp. NHM501043]